jgi:hypothetical protein
MGDLFGDLAANTRTSNLFKFNSDNSYMVYKPYNMQNKGESEEREVCW